MLKLPRNFHVVCSRAMTKQRDVAVLLCGFINLQLFIYFVVLGAMGNLRQVHVDEDALSDFKVPFFYPSVYQSILRTDYPFSFSKTTTYTFSRKLITV